MFYSTKCLIVKELRDGIAISATCLIIPIFACVCCESAIMWPTHTPLYNIRVFIVFNLSTNKYYNNISWQPRERSVNNANCLVNIYMPSVKKMLNEWISTVYTWEFSSPFIFWKIYLIKKKAQIIFRTKLYKHFWKVLWF